MTDENKDLENTKVEDVQDEELDTQDVSEEVDETEDSTEESEQPSFEVEKAKSNGYLSKEQYIEKYGSDNGFKSPQEFNKFGELYPEIKDTLKGISKKLETRDREIAALVKYNADVKDRERQNARNELARALQEARQMGDVDAVQEIAREQQKIDYQDAQDVANRAAEDIQQTQRDFLDRNGDWYNKDPEMTQRAVQIDREIRSGAYAHIFPMPQTHAQLARQIEVIVKQEFANKQQKTPARQGPVISQSGSAIAKTSKTDSIAGAQFKKLPEDLKHLYSATKRVLEEAGDYKYTEEDFINKLRKDGAI